MENGNRRLSRSSVQLLKRSPAPHKNLFPQNKSDDVKYNLRLNNIKSSQSLGKAVPQKLLNEVSSSIDNNRDQDVDCEDENSSKMTVSRRIELPTSIENVASTSLSCSKIVKQKRTNSSASSATMNQPFVLLAQCDTPPNSTEYPEDLANLQTFSNPPSTIKINNSITSSNRYSSSSSSTHQHLVTSFSTPPSSPSSSSTSSECSSSNHNTNNQNSNTSNNFSTSTGSTAMHTSSTNQTHEAMLTNLVKGSNPSNLISSSTEGSVVQQNNGEKVISKDDDESNDVTKKVNASVVTLRKTANSSRAVLSSKRRSVENKTCNSYDDSSSVALLVLEGKRQRKLNPKFFAENSPKRGKKVTTVSNGHPLSISTSAVESSNEISEFRAPSTPSPNPSENEESSVISKKGTSNDMYPYLNIDITLLHCDDVSKRPTLIEGVNIPGVSKSIRLHSPSLPPDFTRHISSNNAGRWMIFYQYKNHPKMLRLKAQILEILKSTVSKQQQTSSSSTAELISMFDFSLDDHLRRLRNAVRDNPKLISTNNNQCNEDVKLMNGANGHTSSTSSLTNGSSHPVDSKSNHSGDAVTRRLNGSSGDCSAGGNTTSENGVRCPVGECNKLFRTPHLLSMHSKHYHSTSSSSRNSRGSTRNRNASLSNTSSIDESGSPPDNKNKPQITDPDMTASSLASMTATTSTRSRKNSGAFSAPLSSRKRKISKVDSSPSTSLNTSETAIGDADQQPQDYNEEDEDTMPSSPEFTVNTDCKSSKITFSILSTDDETENGTEREKDLSDPVDKSADNLVSEQKLDAKKDSSINSNLEKANDRLPNEVASSEQPILTEADLSHNSSVGHDDDVVAGQNCVDLKSSSIQVIDDLVDEVVLDEADDENVMESPSPSPIKSSNVATTNKGAVYYHNHCRVLPRMTRSERLKNDEDEPLMCNSSSTANDEQTTVSGSSTSEAKDQSISNSTEEVVNCVCKSISEHGLMVQCDVCLCWQHGSCMGYSDDTSSPSQPHVPDHHMCRICIQPFRKRSRHSRMGSFKHQVDLTMNPPGEKEEGDKTNMPSVMEKENNGVLSNEMSMLNNSMSQLSTLQSVLHSLRVKLHIASSKQNVKVYMWSSPWIRTSHVEQGENTSKAILGDESKTAAIETTTEIIHSSHSEPSSQKIESSESEKSPHLTSSNVPSTSNTSDESTTPSILSVVSLPEIPKRIDRAESRTNLIQHIERMQLELDKIFSQLESVLLITTDKSSNCSSVVTSTSTEHSDLKMYSVVNCAIEKQLKVCQKMIVEISSRSFNI